MAFHKSYGTYKNLNSVAADQDQNLMVPKILSNQVNMPHAENDKILIQPDFDQNQEYILKANISMMNSNVPKLMPIEDMCKNGRKPKNGLTTKNQTQRSENHIAM